MEEQKPTSDSLAMARRQDAVEWGRKGEQIACDYITSQGFPITERNWHFGKTAEIDIISQQGDVMAFIEVKTRNGKFNDAEDAVDEKKIKQIVRGANAYLLQKEREFEARFDVVLIEGTPDNYEFTYIKEAFVPPLSAI